MKPIAPPVHFAIAQTAKVTTRAFEARLADAGGSLSTWLVLIALHENAQEENGWKLQSELATDVGVRGPTLTHHLNKMELQGLIVRNRLANDRRSHLVEMTDAGRATLEGLKQTATAYDAKLRAALSEKEMIALRDLLARVAAAAT